jgi:hypothetical protein
MAKIKYFALTAAAALVFTACAENALANNAYAASSAEKIAPAGTTVVALVTLENSAYEAWKSKDAKFWETFLSDKFVGWGSSGKLDKASATKEYSGAACEIKSYALSDEHMSPLGKDAALITYKRDTERAAGSSLAVKAMAHGSLSRSPHASNLKLSAVTPRSTSVHIRSLHGGPRARRTELVHDAKDQGGYVAVRRCAASRATTDNPVVRVHS